MMKRFLLSLLIATSSTLCWAGEPTPTYDRINLTASASEEIENDTLVAVLYAQHEDEKASKAASRVNQQITQAISKAKATSGIKVQTLDYNTTPKYAKSSSYKGSQRIVGWRVRQSIRLESKESTKLSNLIGDLQETLALGQISYTVSSERRRQAEGALITQAITHFKQRAKLISGEMDASGYRLVQMNINTGGVAPRPYAMRGMAMEAASAPPALEAGTQRIQVNINGSIELK